MAVALQSASHYHAVYALLKGVEDLRDLHPA
jgi:hypothetical protein